ncbi:hypothetical protein [Citrifermentans bremense]|uniref:hypothetical protein n=1 Tax=Citrifermentans bremense TaxID=60035 RepID=UPI00047C3C33|nr:hypothetical protein [Citrifermentans bremense]
MDYIGSLFKRLWNALATLKFWTEGLIVFILGGLGIWWPLFFNWKGYENFFYPEPWFTYGLATLMVILGQRLFMKEEDDTYIMPNRLILFVLVLTGSLMYGKSVKQYFEFVADGKHKTVFDYSLTRYGMFTTLFAWIIHVVGDNKFDSKDASNALGGKVK